MGSISEITYYLYANVLNLRDDEKVLNQTFLVHTFWVSSTPPMFSSDDELFSLSRQEVDAVGPTMFPGQHVLHSVPAGCWPFWPWQLETVVFPGIQSVFRGPKQKLLFHQENLTSLEVWWPNWSDIAGVADDLQSSTSFGCSQIPRH